MCKRLEATFVIDSADTTNLAIAKMGPGLLGPLPPAQGNLRYVVVAVEYFSKWIKAKPLATITLATIQKCFWQNIVCRFGVPKAITMDNGTQFDAERSRISMTKLARRFILHQ
jgi:hypothetical protein